MPEVCIVLFHRVYKKVHPLEIDEILLKKVKMKCKDINLEGLQCLLRNRMDLLLLSEKIFDIRLIILYKQLLLFSLKEKRNSSSW